MRTRPFFALFGALTSLVTTVPAVGVWTEPFPLLRTQSGSAYPFFQPDDVAFSGGVPLNRVLVAADGSGGAVAVWSTWRWCDTRSCVGPWVLASSRQPGGAWGKSEYLQPLGHGVAHGLPDLAMNSGGDSVAVWSDGFATRLAGDSLWRQPLEQAFGCSVVDTPTGCQGSPRVAIDGSGRSTVVWPSGGTLSTLTLDRTSSTWGNRQILSSSGAGQPAVASGASGQVVAAWVQSTAGGVVIRTARRQGSGPWEGALDVSPEVSGANRPTVAVSSNGDAVVAWEESTGGVTEVHAAMRRSGSPFWGAGQYIGTVQPGDPATAASPVAAMDAAGNATVLYQELSGGAVSLAVATRGVGDVAWSVSPLGQSVVRSLATPPSLAVVADGSAIAGGASGTFRRAGAAGTWTAQPASGTVTRAVALSERGFAVQVGQAGQPRPANEIDQPVTGQWLQQFARVEDAPPPDRDGDGVPDAMDVCPDEVGTIAARGCRTVVVDSPATGGTASPLTLEAGSASIASHWVRGRMSGLLEIRGLMSGATPAEVVVRPPISRVWSSQTRRFGVMLPAGTFRLRIPLNGKYPPGPYEISVVSGGRLLLPTRVLFVAGPRNGLVAQAGITDGHSGSAVTTARGWDMMVARFVFASRAAAPVGRRVKVVWTGPEALGGSAVKPVQRDMIVSTLRRPGGGLIPQGRWTCRLLVNRTTIATASVLIQG